MQHENLPIQDINFPTKNSKSPDLGSRMYHMYEDIHKGNKPPSVHILGDFNFCDIVWPDRLSKSGSPLSLSEGEKFIEILNDHHLEQLVHFPTREKNTLDLIITSLPTQFLDIQSPDRLSDHDIVSGTLKILSVADLFS